MTDMELADRVQRFLLGDPVSGGFSPEEWQQIIAALRQSDLAQTEIKGHMRIEDDLKRDLGLERESHEVTKRMLSDRDDRIAELEKAALRVVEASDRDTKKGLSQQVAVENFSDSRPEEIEYIEAHLALLEAIGQLDEALKSRA